jgi:SAM-dependent MidA family methyltransferase
MSLKARLQAQINAFGPISVAQYMGLCLHDPKDGYYAAHPKLGADGDFLTAPLTALYLAKTLIHGHINPSDVPPAANGAQWAAQPPVAQKQ